MTGRSLTILIKVIVYIVFLFSSTTFAKKPTDPAKPTPSVVDQIIQGFGGNLNIGIVVQDVETGQTIYSRNADRYFIPASNQKLLTAFAALQYLNPNFSYQTRVFLEPSKINNGVLSDNVYLQFTGDPTFTFEQLDKLIGQLTIAGIQTINGNIVIDDSAFDDVAMSPGTTWDDRNYCFGAPLNSMIMDHNCLSVTLTPSTENNPVVLSTTAPQQFMFFINNVITRSSNDNCQINVKLMNDTTYQLTGCLRSTDTAKTIWLAIANPRINMQQALLYLFKKHQINFNGTITFQKINTPLKLFANAASPALPVLINTMLKESDNTIANALFKTIGAFHARETGNWENGSNAVRDILNKTIRLDIAKTTLIDGAGISRYNYLTPKQLLTLLRKVYYSHNATSFISSLPVAGFDGTLRGRMTDELLRGRIRAKTGSETGVTSLAGYLQTKHKRTLAFVIFINGFVESPAKYKALEEQVCAALIQNY